MSARDYDIDNVDDDYLEGYTAENDPGGVPFCPECGHPERACLCDPYERTHD